MRTVGVISDTHGVLRPQALAALRGSDLILHAGDVGSDVVLGALGQLAPVIAVRGNVDRALWAADLPHTQVVEVEGRFLYVLHDLGELDLDPAAAGFQVVISGHSHRPSIATNNGVLFLNPGSAGPRRLQLPVTLARLTIDANGPSAEIIQLQV